MHEGQEIVDIVVVEECARVADVHPQRPARIRGCGTDENVERTECDHLTPRGRRQRHGTRIGGECRCVCGVRRRTTRTEVIHGDRGQRTRHEIGGHTIAQLTESQSVVGDSETVFFDRLDRMGDIRCRIEESRHQRGEPPDGA